MWSVLWGAVHNRQRLELLVWTTAGLLGWCLCVFVVGSEWNFSKYIGPYLQTLNTPHDLGHQTTSGLYFYPSRFVSRCEAGFFPLTERSSLREETVPGCSWGWLNTKTTHSVFRGLRRDISHAASTSFHTEETLSNTHLFFVFVLFVFLDK